MAAACLLFLVMFTGGRRRLDRWEGAVLVAGYAEYVAALLARG